MRLTPIILVVLMLVAGLVSCSSPSPDAESYLTKNQPTTNQAVSTNEVIDVTAQGASAVPAPTIKQAAVNPEDAFKKTVSPGNLPKCVDQFAAAKKVWEKMKEAQEYYGQTPYIYELGDRGYVNGNPMEDMGAKPSPVPLFETWNTQKLEGIEQVESFISHGAIVRVTSRRRTSEGNWYMVKIVNSGFEHIKGWVPEKLVSRTQAIPTGGWGGGYSAGACSTGG